MPRGLAISWLVCGLAVPSVSAADPATVDYLRDIKPILAARCWGCHSGSKIEAGLRLDASQLIRRGGENGKVIVPGKPDESLLWQKVTADADERMPPEGQPLTGRQLARLRAWIVAGAKSPEQEQPARDPLRHWSFQPARRAAVPAVADRDWVRNPIDAFIAARHREQGLVPRPEADRAVLLRRLFLDLVGIPPTRDQLQRFLADDSADAYERTVDELLGNPLYGQRWGRHWMDVWRYSDWYGRRPSNEIRYSQRHIWRWRDWIIESVNADKGFDRMLLEMLAGDEIAPDDLDTLRATGFLGRNWYKFDRNTWLFETVEKTSKGLLALTFRCARCHDHKFDPVTQLEYYRFRAFFEPHGFRTEPLTATVKTEVDNGKAKVLSDGLSRVFDEKLDAPTYLFIRGDDRNPDKEHPLKPGVPAAFGNTDLEISPVSLPPVAYIPELRRPGAERLVAAESAKVTAATTTLGRTREQIGRLGKELAAALADKDNRGQDQPAPFLVDSFDKPRPDTWKPLSGSWKRVDGKLLEDQVISFATIVTNKNHPRDFRVRLVYRTLAAGNPRSIGFSFDYVDGGNSQDVYTAISPGGSTPTVQAFHRSKGQQVYPAAGIRKAPGLKIGQEIHLDVTVVGRSLTIVLDGKPVLEYPLPIARRDGKFALWVHKGSAEFLDLSIGPIRPSAEDLKRQLAHAKDRVGIEELEITVTRAGKAAVEARLAAERTRLNSDPRSKALALAADRAEKQVAIAVAERDLLKAETSLATAPDDAQAGQAVKTARRKLEAARQAHQAADGSYTRFTPRYPTTSTGRRTALARWITDAGNPRTARVAINQVWMRLTGNRFVNTVADFGIRSRPRTHPNLMDWLAVELVESGWSLKHVQRLIVTSSTYRLASTPGSPGNANRATDPDNQYLWQMNSRRMQAEVVRDSVLAVTDALDSAFGGPDLDEKLGQTSPRRSLYFRTTPDNQMQLLNLFDMANPTECYRRRETVIPQQALAMSNSQLTLNQSRRLARRLAGQLGSADDVDPVGFIIAAFEVVLSRPPVDREIAACRGFLARNARLLSDPKSLKTYPAGEGKPIAASADPRARARENLVHILFSHNEFVTIR